MKTKNKGLSLYARRRNFILFTSRLNETRLLIYRRNINKFDRRNFLQTTALLTLGRINVVITKKYSTPGFFDEENRIEQLNKKKYPLLKLSDYIDLEFFRKPLDDLFTKDKDTAKGGRPNYDYMMMFKILILQRYYNLSDDETKFAIIDRLIFMQLLRLTLADKVPDAQTKWHFRDQLAQGEMVEKLFKCLDRQLDKDGIVAYTGKMIDASFIEARLQRNSREENNQVKKCEVSKLWENKPNKLRQKDLDARWTKKNNIVHYCYKYYSIPYFPNVSVGWDNNPVILQK